MLLFLHCILNFRTMYDFTLTAVRGTNIIFSIDGQGCVLWNTYFLSKLPCLVENGQNC
ncbi:hypothetical protein XCR1_1690009 [Xenorhabdus cabanillasii JM26]|uniref:Uncharacterized protein n=1 Tax=Xenorhabdus cabanillasii JM26 TaxID=1427517 RepID=W1IY86_9GAMM|nr:hypothetical protein XCR1_1690009 [Xenorhabdus cabanillasii JM26]